MNWRLMNNHLVNWRLSITRLMKVPFTERSGIILQVWHSLNFAKGNARGYGKTISGKVTFIKGLVC